jgi:hypothetical protein
MSAALFAGWVVLVAFSILVFASGLNGHWYWNGSRNWTLCGAVAGAGLSGLVGAVLVAPWMFHG